VDDVRFQVFWATEIHVVVLWVVRLCSDVVELTAFQRTFLPPTSGWSKTR